MCITSEACAPWQWDLLRHQTPTPAAEVRRRARLVYVVGLAITVSTQRKKDMHTPETDPVNARREARATRRFPLPSVFMMLAVVGIILTQTPGLEDWNLLLWGVSMLCIIAAAGAVGRARSQKDGTPGTSR